VSPFPVDLLVGLWYIEDSEDKLVAAFDGPVSAGEMVRQAVWTKQTLDWAHSHSPYPTYLPFRVVITGYDTEYWHDVPRLKEHMENVLNATPKE